MSIATFFETIHGGVEKPLEQLGHNMLCLMLSEEQACLDCVTESQVRPVLTAVTAAFTSGLPIDTVSYTHLTLPTKRIV